MTEDTGSAVTEPLPPPALRVVRGDGEGGLPRAPQAEESVIAGVLDKPRALREVADIVDPADFTHPGLRAIFEALLSMDAAGRPIDSISVGEEMRRAGTFHQLSELRLVDGSRHKGEPALSALANIAGPADSLAYHAQLVRQKAVARSIIREGSELVQRAYTDQDVEALAARALRQLQEAHERLPRPGLKLFDKEAFKQRALAALARPIPPKLPFGLEDLDKALNGGFPSGGVVVLMAPPKHLKTGFLISRLIAWARLGQRIIYVTGENSAQEIFARLSAHEQFGTTNKFHSRIRHEDKLAAENFAPIEWLGGFVEVLSLPDEEMKEPEGLRWRDVIPLCERITKTARKKDASADAPMLVIDYVEEIADRIGGRQNMTEQVANKQVMRDLKAYAVRTQARVLAVCSVRRGLYSSGGNGDESAVFNKPDAKPQDFAAAAKHSGYVEYAAAAGLALQYRDEARELVTDPETGHKAMPMNLHLAFAREGAELITAKVLSFGGFCVFKADKRDEAQEVQAYEGGVKGQIQRELQKTENAGGQNVEMIARLLGKRVAAIRSALKELVQDKQLVAFLQGRSIMYRHPRFGAAKGEQPSLIDLDPGDPDKEGGGLPN